MPSHPAGPFWSISRIVTLAALGCVFPLLFIFCQPRFPDRGVGFKPVPDPVEGVEAPVYETRTVSAGRVPEVHSPTLIPLNNGGVYAFWYGGESEGSEDTAIYSSKFDPGTHQWSKEIALIDRETTQDQVHRFVKKLGNAVALRDAKGRIWMFYVSSMWGWSGSSINVTFSDDEGVSWSPARRLITTPFLNHSTLVRGQPFLFADGTIGLPVYHEFIGKFCELLRLDERGNIIHKQRITHGRTSLQPAIVPITAEHAVCSMRPAGSSPRQLLVSHTYDGGSTWTPFEGSEVYSDYSGSANIGLENNDLLVITREEEKLLFYVSDDAGTRWERCFEIDHSKDDTAALRSISSTTGRHKRKKGPAYPAVWQTNDGDYHLVYSLDRLEIRHVRFNQSWLNSRK